MKDRFSNLKGDLRGGVTAEVRVPSVDEARVRFLGSRYLDFLNVASVKGCVMTLVFAWTAASVLTELGFTEKLVEASILIFISLSLVRTTLKFKSS